MPKEEGYMPFGSYKYQASELHREEELAVSQPTESAKITGVLSGSYLSCPIASIRGRFVYRYGPFR